MNFTLTKRLLTMAAFLTLTSLGLISASDARADELEQTPTLPPVCENIRVPEGHKAIFHVYARGFQIYRWNGTSWDFVAPLAMLFADANYLGEVGIHFSGPTWQHNSGSKVVASRVNGCTPDTTAIPWLLLRKVTSNGPGIFNKTAYIQRVNTIGGLAPQTPGATIGDIAEVPYTAEYFFYRAED